MSTVVVPPLSMNELYSVVSVRFPSLCNLSHHFVHTYFYIQQQPSTPVSASSASSSSSSSSLPSESNDIELGSLVPSFSVGRGRWFSTRDLMKWCERVCRLGYGVEELQKRTLQNSAYSSSSPTTTISMEFHNKEMGLLPLRFRETVFQEGVDCFCASVPEREQRDALVQRLGRFWDVSSSRTEFYSTTYKPTLQATHKSVTVGRVTVPVTAASIAQSPKVFFFFSLHAFLFEKIVFVTYFGPSFYSPCFLDFCSYFNGSSSFGKTCCVCFDERACLVVW